MTKPFLGILHGVVVFLLGAAAAAQTTAPAIPRFSVDYMDRSVAPGEDFYSYASGTWVKNNPVPPDKSRWGGFEQLRERNLFLIQQLLEDAAKEAASTSSLSRRQVGDLFTSAMDIERIEQLGSHPLDSDLKKIDEIATTNELFTLLADFHSRGIGGLYSVSISPDSKNSAIYALILEQGGLSLPDRDYYLKPGFAAQRNSYAAHIVNMFTLLGEKPEDAAAHAGTVIDVETALATASRARVDLRDPLKNYNKFSTAELIARTPTIPWGVYFTQAQLQPLDYAVVGQPEFFDAIDTLVQRRPLSDWKIYLRWQLLHQSAPYLHKAAEEEDFAFFRKILSGQPEMEPRWKRAARIIDRNLGEALGEIYVEKYFPPEARQRMSEMVANIKVVFREHLQAVDWMTDATRARALAKFDRFTTKIGFPEKFRDYSSVEIRRDDFLGNVRRAQAFDERRQIVRLGKPVDKSEWGMTPPTVNAYCNPLFNEIVFPAGILQPPFFDVTMDDAVNYGGIGVVIGHEITHHYDDEGRHYDADGNLTEWWTEADAKAFESRAQKVVDEYDAFEMLPGLHVNGRLTLGENIADLGGVAVAYDAMQRALDKNPSQRKTIDGFTPEQRFFISYSQLWRTNIREPEVRRLITTDPHSPGRFRGFGPLVNFEPFYKAFGIEPGQPMWRPPELRAKIW